MSRAIVRRAPKDSAILDSALHPVLRRVLAARAVESLDELDCSLAGLLPPALLGGTAAAAGLLHDVMAAQGRILIVGDFDADGATSCALCVRALRAMGHERVDYLVPNRFEFGYGLTPEIVELAARRQPDLLMTVDNGIASISGVAAARRYGMRVLVTDHHLAGDALPEADVIVNPNRPGETFPDKALAGVGVAFYVLLALRARLRGHDWFARHGIAEPNLAQWLDLVALGTVADVVPLTRNNRILVQQGLQRIRAGRCVPALGALLELAGRNPQRAVSSDLGFAVGPRLNAAGRLEDMALGIECLLSDSPVTARTMAGQLDELNRNRRDIESDMQTRAQAMLERLVLDGSELPHGLCLYEPDWHQGVVGILAARIKERLHRPAIVFARGQDGEIRGSARSVRGLHIRDAIDTVATAHPGLVRRFGGHAMAAGLTLAESDFSRFADAFDREVRHHLSAADLRGVIESDGELSAQELSLDVARLLRDVLPWGQGFPAPLFDGEFEIVSQRVVGERHLKLTVRAAPGERAVDAIAFNTPALAPGCASARLAYRLDVNEYRGAESAQLIVEYLEA